MSDILIHPHNQEQLQAFIEHPSHAILLIGPEGIGKRTLSDYLAAQLLQLPDTTALNHYPYITYVEPEKDSTSIEAVRDLQHFIKLKVPTSEHVSWRLIVITQAHSLTIEAQNALLKMLEEPPEDTIFLLNATNEQTLLPTILSRVQRMTIAQPTHELVVSHFTSLGHRDTAVQQAYMLSGGLPGLMTSLLSEEDEHPLKKSVEEARTLLRATTFERLAMVDTFAKDKVETFRLLFVLQQMARAALTQSVSKEPTSARQAITRWQRILDQAYQTEAALLANAQPKLVLTNLLLHI